MGDQAPAQPRAAKRRRRVVYVSEVDQRLLELGLEPSWDQQVSEADRALRGDLSLGGEGAQRHVDDSNDQRLLENVPPHSHARQ